MSPRVETTGPIEWRRLDLNPGDAAGRWSVRRDSLIPPTAADDELLADPLTPDGNDFISLVRGSAFVTQTARKREGGATESQGRIKLGVRGMGTE